VRFEPLAAIGRLDVVGCDYYRISQRGRLCEEAGTSEEQISPLRDAPRRSGRNDAVVAGLTKCGTILSDSSKKEKGPCGTGRDIPLYTFCTFLKYSRGAAQGRGYID
jgi:hypothetical protein